jgi:tripartite-type tricarboxylate transporter receptor subunit TctC
MSKRFIIQSLCAAALLAAVSATAQAQSVEQFYKGKTVNLYIGYATGGGYDFFGRLTARHMGRHIPGNPTIVPQNMPGAGSLKAANYLYTVAPKDGTALGIITQTVAIEEALGTPGVQYKSAAFNWVGRVTSNVEISLMWHTSKVQSIEDAKKIAAPVAGTGPGSPAEVYPKVLNAVVGTKFKVITGYPGSNDGLIAMERGETDGALTSWNTTKTSKKNWLDEKKIAIIVQYAPERHPDLPNVPTAVELGSTPEQKKVLELFVSGAAVGRSILTTPNVPADRLTALRAAFDAMIADKVFLDEVEKTKAEFDPLSGEKLQKIVEDAANIPPDVLKMAKAARGND